MAHIYLASPHMSEEGYEQQYVKEAFDTNWIAPLGKNVNEFEKELAAYVGSKDAAALSAGSAALHLALKAAGVKAGDIVFCQDLTFSATANPIAYEKAIRSLSTVIMRPGICLRKHWSVPLRNIPM